VSDKVNLSILEPLSPHVDNKYWNDLYKTLETGHDLVLVMINYNNSLSTSNLFIPESRHPTLDDLAVVMTCAPVICLLIRGSDIKLLPQSIINRFVELVYHDPLSEFYLDKLNPTINDKGILPITDLPKFVTLPQNSFEEWG